MAEMAQRRDNTGESVVLLTRMQGANTGNEALSIQFIKLFRELLPNRKVLVLDRLPNYPLAITNSLTTDMPETVLNTFESIAEKLEEDVRRSPTPVYPDEFPEARVTLTTKGRRASTRALIKQIRAPFRPVKRAVRTILGTRDRTHRRALLRLSLLRNAALVVWNPAGELEPNTEGAVPMQVLLELAVAHRFGTRFAILNHTVEVRNANLKKIISHVYPEAEAVFVREQSSRRTLEGLGIDGSKLHVVPDLAFLIDCKGQTARRALPPSGHRAPIGIAINGNHAMRDPERWFAIVRRLLENGEQVRFVSNCVTKDFSFGTELKKRFGIACQPAALSYTDYIGYLSELEMVISSRLHTAIFCLVSGVTVIPVEPQMYKVDALMRQIGYPIPTLHVSDPSCADKLIQSIEHVRRNKDSMNRELDRIVRQVRGEIGEKYSAFARTALST